MHFLSENTTEGFLSISSPQGMHRMLFQEIIKSFATWHQSRVFIKTLCGSGYSTLFFPWNQSRHAKQFCYHRDPHSHPKISHPERFSALRLCSSCSLSWLWLCQIKCLLPVNWFWIYSLWSIFQYLSNERIVWCSTGLSPTHPCINVNQRLINSCSQFVLCMETVFQAET